MDAKTHEALSDIAARLGASANLVSPEELRAEEKTRKGWRVCPFATLDMAIRWEDKEVWYTKDILAIAAIHELGHILVDLQYPRGDELAFLGWEFAVQRKLALALKIPIIAIHREWRTCSDYGLGESFDDPEDFIGESKDLDERQLNIVVKRYLREAIKANIVTKDLQPLTLR